MRLALIVAFVFATATSAQAYPASWDNIDCKNLGQVEAPSWLPSQTGMANHKLPEVTPELKEVRGTQKLIAAVKAAEKEIKSRGYTLAGFNMTVSWSDLLKDFCEQKTDHSGAELEKYLSEPWVLGSLQGCVIQLSIRSKKGKKLDQIDISATSLPKKVQQWWKMSYDFYTKMGFVNLATSRDNPNWDNTDYMTWFYQCAEPPSKYLDYR